MSAHGNGRLNAVSNALKSGLNLSYSLQSYKEHDLEGSSSSKAVSYVSIKGDDDTIYWGVGIDTDIVTSSNLALISAINIMINEKNKTEK